ncbi:MAG: hypothetical protein KGL16_13380, partial [Acidobacteriota bacterium]|nr:hypothetical protein [Acidobacteriota bacterium]
MRALPEEPNVAPRPNVALRPTGEGDAQEVVLAFPYDGHLVAAVRTLPGRRFDWDRREWSAPADGWVAAKLAEILKHRPELRRTEEFDQWLAEWKSHMDRNDDEALIRSLIQCVVTKYRRDARVPRMLLFAALEGHQLGL